MPGSRLGLAVLLAVTLLAGCQAPLAPSATPTDDAFVGVRRRAEEAYQEGRQALARGELDQALASFDRAKVNDPDDRQDIREALNETLRRLQAVSPVAASPTLAPLPSPAAAATGPEPTPPPDMARWNDPAGRFSLAVPLTWRPIPSPGAAFGTARAGFRSPDGTAELVVAEDASAEVVSPELYAARMELAMQKVPGYALESLVPGSAAGGPTVRRTFGVRQRDGSGQERLERAFQVVLLRGSTPWVLEGSASVEAFAAANSTLDRMVDSFRLR